RKKFTKVFSVVKNMLIVRSPVRISFGGGGTDLPAYYSKYTGAVISVTIDKYFYSSISWRQDKKIEITSDDYKMHEIFDNVEELNLDDVLNIPKAVLKYFNISEGLHLHLESEIPTGSGLGLSGAVAVNLVKAISTLKEGRELSKQEIAELACVIEIDELKRPVGKQDQYASAFGGLNFIEFYPDRVQVSPMKISKSTIELLEKNLMLFYTGFQRDSAEILSQQKKSTEQDTKTTIDALHNIKNFAYQMREALKEGDLNKFGHLLHVSWENKKKVDSRISTSSIDKYYEAAIENGALGGKITGAGGGGFLLLYCDKKHQERVRNVLKEFGLKELKFKFDFQGVQIIMDEKGGVRKMITPEGYLAAINSIVKQLPIEKINRIIDILFDAYKKDRQVFIMGNGGSAATASHFSCDLAKTAAGEHRKGFRVVPLTDNVALMTAWGNDTGYENIFWCQLKNLLKPEDIAIGISCAGKSKSVIKAIEYANSIGAMTIGFTGMTGAQLKELAKEYILVPSDNYQLIEDVHVILAHLIVSILREKIDHESSVS
ncbi:MAG: SIS domain-containing protein, partial [Elusimicrobiota bacterium]|nr:SIS domain-containing protein [Elusimicrobiota bacterium]